VNYDCWYTKGTGDSRSSESSVRSVIHKVNTMLIFFTFEELFSSTVKIALWFSEYVKIKLSKAS